MIDSPKINAFRTNPVLQEHLANLFNDEVLQRAMAIVAAENELIAVPLDAPEIMSVRAHSQARGAKRALDILFILATPYKKPEVNLPESDYQADETTDQSL